MNHRFDQAKKIVAIIASAGFGWGVLWSGTQGIRLAFQPVGNPSQNQMAAVRLSTTPAETTVSPDQSTPTVSFKSSATILIGGDLMFDRKIRLLGQTSGYESLLAPLLPLFHSADLAIANLEGPITSQPSQTLRPDKTTTKSLTFTFAPTVAKTLAKSGITAVSLANNHTDNFGSNGLIETRKLLQAAEVGYFGSPWNATTTDLVVSRNNIRIALVGYHAFYGGFERILENIRQHKTDGDFVIVMPHWGVEYATSSSFQQRSQARAMVAAGADAVIGSHPHVVMDHEWIGQVPVFYSLGNLLFDQYFSSEVMKGNLVKLHLTRDQNGTRLESLEIYQTSTASKKNVTVTDQPIYDEKPETLERTPKLN